MALHKRGGVYHYHFWIDGARYRGSTKKTNLAAAQGHKRDTIGVFDQRGAAKLLKVVSAVGIEPTTY